MLSMRLVMMREELGTVRASRTSRPSGTGSQERLHRAIGKGGHAGPKDPQGTASGQVPRRRATAQSLHVLGQSLECFSGFCVFVCFVGVPCSLLCFCFFKTGFPYAAALAIQELAL